MSPKKYSRYKKPNNSEFIRTIRNDNSTIHERKLERIDWKRSIEKIECDKAYRKGNYASASKMCKLNKTNITTPSEKSYHNLSVFTEQTSTIMKS